MPTKSNNNNSRKSSSSSSTSCSTILLAMAIIFPVIIGLIIQYGLYAGVDRPDSDHGSGSMFDKIASRYDAINRVLALGMDQGWRIEMVKQIKTILQEQAKEQADDGIIVTPPRILDVSTGTADVALLLAKYIPQANVIGIDPSEKMLDIGRDKIQAKQQQDRISLQQFDARDPTLQTTFQQQPFDAGTWAFGIRNVVPNRMTALCRIHSLMRHEAPLAILEFGEPQGNNLGETILRWLIRHAVPVLGGLLSGAPQEYWHLQASIAEFPTPKEFVQQIHQLECDPNGNDQENSTTKQEKYFHVERVHQMVFGSVQIYMMSTIKEPKQTEQIPQETEAAP